MFALRTLSAPVDLLCMDLMYRTSAGQLRGTESGTRMSVCVYVCVCMLVPLKWRCPSTKVDVTLKSGPGKDDRPRIKRTKKGVDESRATSALLHPLFSPIFSLSFSLLSIFQLTFIRLYHRYHLLSPVTREPTHANQIYFHLESIVAVLVYYSC